MQQNQKFFKLSISDLRLWVHLGCTDYEKFHPQLVSLTIDFVFKTIPEATVTDKLDDTVCYSRVVESIKSSLQAKRFNLIEHLTVHIRKAILTSIGNQLKNIASITVMTHKVAPPVNDVYGGVFLTYTDTISDEGE